MEDHRTFSDPEHHDTMLSEVAQSDFLVSLSLATREVCEELGLGVVAPTIDLHFLAFLRLNSRFGLFTFGPVTIFVPTIEDVVFHSPRAREDDGGASFGRFVRALRDEQIRSGRRRIDELHALLALMRLNEGLPARVFGELGVSPEEVEEYARSGSSGKELEKLYSPEEAAEYLGIHVQTVRAWIRSGRLRASRLAGQRALRIKASDLATVLEPVEPEAQEA
jgi:excisionase family DNA binding protein